MSDLLQYSITLSDDPTNLPIGSHLPEYLVISTENHYELSREGTRLVRDNYQIVGQPFFFDNKLCQAFYRSRY